MRALRSLIIAFSTYSRIPMPRVEWSDENRRFAMCFFPLVGAVVGGAIWLWTLLAAHLGLNAFTRGAIAALIPLLITGGIHMDGFMDTLDAVASWQPVEKKLEILKDSRVGAFAAMGCAGYLLAEAALLGEARPDDMPMIAVCFVLSRALSAYLATALKSARPQGMLDSFTRASRLRLVGASGAVYAAAAMAVFALCDFRRAIIACACAAACAAYYRHMAYKQFGGVTGDLAGWFSQVTELALILCAVIGGRIS